ncbi:unnamed protein product [Mucor hiemalis]
MEYYVKAAEEKNTVAYNNIGDAYKYGLGVEKDYVKAMEWYMKSVDIHCSLSLSNIGRMYLEGLGVEADYAIALEYFEESDLYGSKDAKGLITETNKKITTVKQSEGSAKEKTAIQLAAAEKAAIEAAEEIAQLKARLVLLGGNNQNNENLASSSLEINTLSIGTASTPNQLEKPMKFFYVGNVTAHSGSSAKADVTMGTSSVKRESFKLFHV